MAITGRFEADFEDFYAAVNKAEAKLTDFQSGAGKVEKSLNQMVDSFSGRRLIQEATISAEAIERIGGTSKLTGDELQKVAAKASEAVAKMKAMGVEVPPGIRKIADELKPIPEETSKIESAFTKVGGVIAGAFAVGKVVDFVLNIGKAQQALSRLSAETQIGVEDLQDITTATRGYGLSNEELAKALFNVSKGIASGDDSVARGLHKIGLSLDELKNKRGKELFLEIERGLAQLQGSLRDTAASDIFGSKLGASMAGFAVEADKAVDAAEKFSRKLSAEEVEKLKRYADEIERTKQEFGTLATKATGATIDAIHSIGLKFREGGAHIRDFFNALAGGKGTPNLDKLRENVAALSGDIAKSVEEQNKLNAGMDQTAEKGSKEYQALQFLTALRADSAKALESYQLRALEDLRSMGQLNQQNAAAIGVSADQFKQYTENVRIAEATTKSLTAATLANEAALEKIAAQVKQTHIQQTGTQTEIELAAIQAREDAEISSQQRRTDALKASLAAQHADTKETIDKIDAENEAALAKIKGYYSQLAEGVGIDFNAIKESSHAVLQDAADRALKTLIEARGTIGVTRETLDKLTEDYRRAAFAATAMGRQSVEASDKSTEAINKTKKALDEQAAAAKKAQEAVTVTTEITAANFDKFTTPQGVSRSDLVNLLHQGFSLENALSILQAANRGNPVDISKWPVDQRGPRVPGFKYGVDNFSGGAAIVGEDGPELVNLPRGSSVLPLRGGARSGGAGTSIYAPVYVSGVFDPSSRHVLGSTVEDALFRNISNARVVR